MDKSMALVVSLTINVWFVIFSIFVSITDKTEFSRDILRPYIDMHKKYIAANPAAGDVAKELFSLCVHKRLTLPVTLTVENKLPLPLAAVYDHFVDKPTPNPAEIYAKCENAARGFEALSARVADLPRL